MFANTVVSNVKLSPRLIVGQKSGIASDATPVNIAMVAGLDPATEMQLIRRQSSVKPMRMNVSMLID